MNMRIVEIERMIVEQVDRQIEHEIDRQIDIKGGGTTCSTTITQTV